MTITKSVEILINLESQIKDDKTLKALRTVCHAALSAEMNTEADEVYEAIQEAFNCSDDGIYFGYLCASDVEKFKDIDALIKWYRSLKPTE